MSLECRCRSTLPVFLKTLVVLKILVFWWLPSSIQGHVVDTSPKSINFDVVPLYLRSERFCQIWAKKPRTIVLGQPHSHEIAMRQCHFSVSLRFRQVSGSFFKFDPFSQLDFYTGSQFWLVPWGKIGGEHTQTLIGLTRKRSTLARLYWIQSVKFFTFKKEGTCSTLTRVTLPVRCKQWARSFWTLFVTTDYNVKVH